MGLIELKINSEELKKVFYLGYLELDVVPTELKGDNLTCNVTITGTMEIPVDSILENFGESFILKNEEKTDDGED